MTDQTTNPESPSELHGPALDLPDFSGPLDVLLHLIRKNKLSVYDVPIVKICDLYQEYLRSMQELDLEIAGEFIWMASWLLHLKSRTLLPRAASSGDEDDPRMELVERLLEFRRVKELASMFHETDTVRRCLQTPQLVVPDLNDEVELDWEDVDLRVIAQAYLDVMERFATANPPPLKIAPLRFNVEEKMRELYDQVHQNGMFQLLEFLNKRSDSEEIVALVVATLELVRLGGIRAEQRRVFSEIYLHPGTRVLDGNALLKDWSSEATNGA